MEQQKLDPTWVTTEKILTPNKSGGYDTCARINAILTYSHIFLCVLIEGIGEFQVTRVQPMNDENFVHVTCIDHDNNEFHYALFWNVRFYLHLGKR